MEDYCAWNHSDKSRNRGVLFPALKGYFLNIQPGIGGSSVLADMACMGCCLQEIELQLHFTWCRASEGCDWYRREFLFLC